MDWQPEVRIKEIAAIEARETKFNEVLTVVDLKAKTRCAKNSVAEV